ncbi:MAG: hypothetical protein V1729_06465 [Candidatus Woesearchaeota archaeon]
MGVVRIDNELEQEIEALIKRRENRFKYPSKSAFLNVIINDYLVKQKKR